MGLSWTYLTHLIVSMVHLVLQDHLPADLTAVIDDDVQLGPRAKLSLPVGDGGKRGDDEEGSSQTHVEDLVQECDGLDGLPQAHFVSQDTVFPAPRES